MPEVTLLPLSIETDAVTDAAKLLAAARQALICDPTLNPERDALAEALDGMASRPWTPGLAQLAEGVAVMTPPPAWTALLREARRLGVIR